MQVGTMSTGEKDDAGRPMGTIIASSRGMICLLGFDEFGPKL